MAQQAQQDPYASIAKPIPPSGGTDPYASMGSQPASTASTPPQPPHGFNQESFDYNTTTDPKESLLKTGLKSVVGGAGGMFVHPLQTLEGATHMGNPYDPENPLAKVIPGAVQDYKDAGGGGRGAAYAGTKLLGNTLGGLAAGEGIGEGLGAARAGGSALRSAAIGDTDAAALKALNVPAKSPRVQSTLNAVEKSRPYLAGAKNLEDLQSRIPSAKNEIWSPYQQGVEAIGNRPVQGPSGMSDVRGLEGERQQFSAINRGLKSKMPNPEAVRLAEQKGMSQADALQHERAIKSALDPELASTGIKPGATRSTFGGVAKVGERVSGRSTVGEESQPYGLGKLANLDITKPFSMVKPVFEAGRDIVAGRPLFSGKPTDVAVRDAFRYGGPKPDLGRLQAPSMAAAQPLRLPSPAAQLGRAPEPGGTPEGYQPPPFYRDTDAMRRGMLLKAPPIELGGRVDATPPPTFYHDTSPMRTGRLLGKPPVEMGGRIEGTPPPTVHSGTTPMRQGRLLPEPGYETPVSSHIEAFPEQRAGSTLLRKRKP